MHITNEYFNEDGLDLRNVLMDCIYNYYSKYKSSKNKEKGLQNDNIHSKMDTTNKKVLSDLKGGQNVL